MGSVYRFEELVMVATAMSVFRFAALQIHAWISPPAGSLSLRALQPTGLPATAAQHRSTNWTAYHDGSVLTLNQSHVKEESERKASRAANHIPPPPLDAHLTKVVRLPKPTQTAG